MDELNLCLTQDDLLKIKKNSLFIELKKKIDRKWERLFHVISFDNLDRYIIENMKYGEEVGLFIGFSGGGVFLYWTSKNNIPNIGLIDKIVYAKMQRSGRL